MEHAFVWLSNDFFIPWDDDPRDDVGAFGMEGNYWLCGSAQGLYTMWEVYAIVKGAFFDIFPLDLARGTGQFRGPKT